MLRRLYIKNFTIIDELDISFEEGFSAVTGETGAGKSIILGAINLLLGQRAAADKVRNGEGRCIIEAQFDIGGYGMEPLFEAADIDYDDECIMRRELTAAGKSRAFINDTPVGLNSMRAIGQQLVDIHSQHQNLLLNEADFQLGVLDIIAGDKALLTDYRQRYADYIRACKDVDSLKSAMESARQQEDFLRYRFKELEDAHLTSGEQEQLEQESEMLGHIEDIKRALCSADDMLNGTGGIVERMKEVSRVVAGISAVCAPVRETAARIESSYIELKDIARDISSQAESTDYDPQRLEHINNRLDTIYTLQRKHNVNSTDELLTLHDTIAGQLAHIDNSEEELSELTARRDSCLEHCKALAAELNKARTAAARAVEEEMRQRLVPLGMPNVAFTVSIKDKPLSADGYDNAVFLFSANAGMPLQPVAQVASGGEIARVMLSLKAMISGAVKLPTIIFDEIDTGVSGKTAEQMATVMREMADNGRQVISITHLPQIAARGNNHYRVFKEETAQGTTSSMTLLTADERLNEIAQMLSGAAVTEAAYSNARELLTS